MFGYKHCLNNADHYYKFSWKIVSGLDHVVAIPANLNETLSIGYRTLYRHIWLALGCV